VEVFSMRRLLGWSAMVGGTLAGAAAALLLLGPALGFYPWSPASPGARTTGSVDLPRAPAAAPQLRAAASLVPDGTLGGLASGVALTLGSPTASAPTAAGGARDGVRRSSSSGSLVAVTDDDGGQITVLTPDAPAAPAAPAPAVSAPPAPAAEPPAAATPEPVAVSTPTTAAQRPTTNSFSASSSNDTDEESAAETEVADDRSPRRESVIAKAIEKKQARTGRGRSEAAPPAAPAPEAAPVASGEDDGEGRGWALGRDRSQGDNDDHNHGRGHDHHGHEDRPGRGGKD
jgi:hypothetical protein